MTHREKVAKELTDKLKAMIEASRKSLKFEILEILHYEDEQLKQEISDTIDKDCDVKLARINMTVKSMLDEADTNAQNAALQ